MAILFSNEILDSVKKELNYAESSVQIITAYCKETTFSLLDGFIKDTVKSKRLLVRLRMDDVLKGSTDLEIIKSGFEKGWKIYIRFDLHAKTYVIDNKRGLIGSANATNSGLSIGQAGNMEMATLVDVESKDIHKINKLFDDAILVDQNLYESLKNQIAAVDKSNPTKGYMWDKSITELFKPHIETLFSYELPEDFELEEGEYFSFIDKTFDGNISEFKDTFRWSNSYLWLVTVLEENDGCLYFGSITEKLHNSLVSDPKPYRRDVKHMLTNLLNLIERLHMDEVVIDQPNYSQRVRLVSRIKNN